MKNLYSAIANFQAELKPVSKDSKNPFFKSEYASLPQIMTEIQPLLSKHKLAVVQMMTSIGDHPALKTIIAHESGESVEDVTPLFLVKTDPQSHGSAVTYARRYALCSALGIVADEDDDGNKASQPAKQTYTPQKTSTSIPVSTPQKELIISLMAQKGLNNRDVVTQSKIDTTKLTGGKEGTASKLITWLQEYTPKPNEKLPVINLENEAWDTVVDTIAQNTPL